MHLSTSASSNSNNLEQNIASELVNLIYSQAKPAIIGSSIVVMCLAYCLQNIIPNTLLYSWLGLMICTSIMRFALVKIYFRKQHTAQEQIFWHRIFIFAVSLGGLSWSLMGTYLMPANNVYQTFIASTLAGVAAGAIPFFSGSRAACFAFIFPMLFPFSVWAFYQADRPHILLGYLTILYMCLLLISCFRTHKAIYHAIKLKFENDELVTNLHNEVNERKNAENLATHDPLTDLPNRSLFNAKFSQALTRCERREQKLALLFLDLDHFKNINDTLGHDVGDTLLIKVVARISAALRNTDLLARLGGDEFTIILEAITQDEVIQLVKQIHHTLASPFELSGKEVFITISIGISMYPDDGTEMKILMKNADMATYSAKEKGRNTFAFYTASMNDSMLKKTRLENELRASLAKKEFHVYYQPVMDISSNSIMGVEALLRWKHPINGFIPPSEFIPIAENSGLIIPLGEWVLQDVFKQTKTWRVANSIPERFRSAINISARQFKEVRLVQFIKSMLDETGLSGESITLEMTETLIMHDIDYSVNVIKALKNLGINISIDDFGTGYSSLNYLRRFPIDILKIDRSFILDIHDTTEVNAVAIVKAIIAMAHSLHLKVIAEGVETMLQYNFLKEEGCDEMQGYLLSQPLPPEQVESFLQSALSVENYLLRQNKRDIPIE